MKTSITTVILFILLAGPVSAAALMGTVFSGPADNICQDQKKEAVTKTVYTCPMHPEVVQDKAGKCPKCGMNLTVKEANKDTYTCPMHPEVVQDKAGKCPKCGMDLVLKKN